MKHLLFAKPILLAAVSAGLLAIPAAADKKPAWTHFADPNEHAFTMDVPAGWHVQGGMTRRGSIDVSPYMRVESPDGQQLLMLGDAGPVYFQTPGFGARGPTHRYLPGEEYARNYVQQSVAPLCENLQFQSDAERADIANGLLAQQTPRAQHDAGEVVFSCSHAGKTAHVYMVAATFLYASPIRTLPGTWGVVMLAGCIAPPDRLDASRKMVLHMLVSSRYDRQWVVAQQARVDQRTRTINAITGAQQAEGERDRTNFQAQMGAQTQQYNAFSEVQTGSGSFADSSGNMYQMSNTQPYHWIGSGGQAAQTSGAAPPPGTGWQPVRQVPPH